EGHVTADALPDQRGRYCEHLTHAGPPGGPFKADYHHIAGTNLARLHRRERRFLRIEDARRPVKVITIMAGTLNDASFRRQVAVEDCVSAGQLDGICNWSHHILWRCRGECIELLE